MFDDIQDFDPPFYLFASSIPCWDCGEVRRVIGVAAGDGEPFMLTEIIAMPGGLLDVIRTVQPAYQWCAPRSSGRSGYWNVCPCGAHFGDYYLFSRPGGAFFPRSPEEAGKVQIYSLEIDGSLHIECSPGMGTGGMILMYGQRMPLPAHGREE